MMRGPTVNINGTSREELIAQVRAVVNAAAELNRVLGFAVPHGRDYSSAVLSHHDREVWGEYRLEVEKLRKEYEDILERLHE